MYQDVPLGRPHGAERKVTFDTPVFSVRSSAPSWRPIGAPLGTLLVPRGPYSLAPFPDRMVSTKSGQTQLHLGSRIWPILFLHFGIFLTQSKVTFGPGRNNSQGLTILLLRCLGGLYRRFPQKDSKSATSPFFGKGPQLAHQLRAIAGAQSVTVLSSRATRESRFPRLRSHLLRKCPSAAGGVQKCLPSNLHPLGRRNHSYELQTRTTTRICTPTYERDTPEEDLLTVGVPIQVGFGG